MARRLAFLGGLLVAACGGGSGGAGDASPGPDAGTACATQAECPAVACRLAACVSGRCAWTPAAEGAPCEAEGCPAPGTCAAAGTCRCGADLPADLPADGADPGDVPADPVAPDGGPPDAPPDPGPACVSAATCPPATGACRRAVCDPATGTCGTAPADDGTPCDDGKGCAAADRCLAGACAGGPDPAEACNGQDDDCDGATDEVDALGCTPRWADADGDGSGGGPSVCLCGPDPAYPATAGGDCDDHDPDVRPGVPEQCNGRDDDCDGVTDGADAKGCAPFYVDGDADGHGTGAPRCLCAAAAPWTAPRPDDCDDADPAVHPGVPEACNGRDDDCDGVTDPEDAAGCLPAYPDGDGDGWGRADGSCLCTAPAGTSAAAGDCDDADPAIHPGAAERCDGVDQDCDGETDEGLGSTTCGTGACRVTVPDCAGGRTQHCLPGAPVPETCDGRDDDCDGATDEEDASGCVPHWVDADRDGWGLARGVPRCLCAPAAAGWSTATGDCDDADPAVHPGASVCGRDGDCDGDAADPGEACDDGPSPAWDGCRDCAWTEFVANADTAGDQAGAAVAAAPDGGFLAAWSGPGCLDPACLATEAGIFARRVGPDGVLAAAQVHVNAYTTGIQAAPSVGLDASGRAVVAWTSAGQDGSGSGVYARRLDAAAAPLGAEFRVNGTTAGDQAAPRVAVAADGRFAIGWQAPGATAGTLRADVRRFDAAGAAVGAEVTLSAAGASASAPALAVDGTGQILAAWLESSAGTGTTVAATRRAWDLKTRHDWTVATSGVAPLPPALAAPVSGGCVVAWVGTSGGSLRVLVRRFAADDTALGPAVDAGPADAASAPAVAATWDGRFLVAWTLRTAVPAGVRVRAFAADGTPEGDAVRLDTPDDPAPSDGPALALWPFATTAAAAWSRGGQDGDGDGILLRRLADDGTPGYH